MAIRDYRFSVTEVTEIVQARRIPQRSNIKNRLSFFPKLFQKARTQIEQAVSKLKRFKRIGMCCEKAAENYAALLGFTFGMILAKSVHRDSSVGI